MSDIKIGILEKDGIEYETPVEYPTIKYGQDLRGLVPITFDSTMFMSNEWKTKILSVATQTTVQHLSSTASPLTLNTLTEEDVEAIDLEDGTKLKINKEDVYNVSYKLVVEQTSGNSRSEVEAYLEVDTGVGFQKVSGSTVYIYSRQSSHGRGSSHSESILTLPIGSRIRVMCRISAGSGNMHTIANECSLTVKQTTSTHNDINFGVVSKEWTPSVGDSIDFVLSSKEWTP